MKNRAHKQIILLPVFALIAAVVFWGASFTAARIALQVMRPLAVTWLRMGIGTLALLPFLGKFQFKSIRRKDVPIIGLYLILQPCLYYLLETNALRFTTSSQAGVISAVVPLFIALGAYFFLKEQLSKLTIVGLIISIAATVVLSVFGTGDGAAENAFLGNGLELGAMICAAASMVIIKYLSGRYSPWTLTALQVFAGFVFFSPGAYFAFTAGKDSWTGNVIFSLLFLGLFVTIGAFGLYNWALSKLSAAKASSFINLVPAVAVAIGWTVLGESLNWIQIIAAVVILVGVFLSQRG